MSFVTQDPMMVSFLNIGSGNNKKACTLVKAWAIKPTELNQATFNLYKRHVEIYSELNS